MAFAAYAYSKLELQKLTGCVICVASMQKSLLRPSRRRCANRVRRLWTRMSSSRRKLLDFLRFTLLIGRECLAVFDSIAHCVQRALHPRRFDSGRVAILPHDQALNRSDVVIWSRHNRPSNPDDIQRKVHRNLAFFSRSSNCFGVYHCILM